MANTIKNSREKALLITAAIVLGGVMLFVTIIDPQLKHGEILKGQMYQLQVQLAKMRGDVLIKDRIEQMYRQIEPRISSTRTDQQEISLLARQINDLYSKLPIKIHSVKILPLTNSEFYRKISLKIDMSGNIKDVMKFVNSIETCVDPIKIEQLNLKAREIVDRVQASFLISKVVTKPYHANSSEGKSG